MTFTLGFYIESVPFTKATRDGETSLGGSESACVCLARALKARGHEVHIFATQLAQDAQGTDPWGVFWHPETMVESMADLLDFDVWTVLRMWPALGRYAVKAGLRLLWNQDLLHDGWPVMSTSWAVDGMVYVSDYQRQQWEERQPEFKNLGWVTHNPIDLSAMPTDPVERHRHRAIYISRPERGLKPLLEMWPRLRARIPDAELHICRYNSMYDVQGWGKVCAEFDREVARVNAEVGGITWLGELNKPALYRALQSSAVLWYPGVADFAETSCLAAVEAQACGVPIVASYKGALPETAPWAALIPGDASTPTYQERSIDAVVRMMTTPPGPLPEMAAHVARYDAPSVAEDWERLFESTLTERRRSQAPAILRALLHEDEHVGARVLASELGDGEAVAFCDRVIAGEDQKAEDYGARSLPDPVEEARVQLSIGGRIRKAVDAFKGCAHVLDVACGNGFMALALAQTYPEMRVTGFDYSEANVAKAREGVARMGLGDRVRIEQGSAYDAPAQQSIELPVAHESVDGLFVGEFLEHVANAPALIDALDRYLKVGGIAIYTMPHGSFVECIPLGIPLKRGHVHSFTLRDLTTLFGGKVGAHVEQIEAGMTPRGNSISTWFVRYTSSAENRPAGTRDLARRALVTRPKARLSVGILAGPSAAATIRWTLESVWSLADEIIVGDAGMGEDARAICAPFNVRFLDLPPVHELAGGFSEARNRILAEATGEWFLWIDTDERLIGGEALHQYLDGHVFNGLALHQNHLMLDAPMDYDLPVRVFRTSQGYQFFGCIHEQPGLDHGNGDIVPALELTDVQIAHLGYLTEPARRHKMLQRNLPLLKRDMQMFPTRRLGRVLVLRDLVNLADYEDEEAGGMTRQGRAYCATAIALFEQQFADPADKYHTLARPWYEKALRAIGEGYEIELAMGGKRGGMNGSRAKTERVWVRGPEELERVVRHKLDLVKKPMTPTPIHTDPFPDVEVDP